MAIASISSNYIGRKKDISIFQYPDASKLGEQTVAPKFGKSARFCTGVQKVVQAYAVILMTNLSSQENYPSFGTDFLYTLQGGISPVDSLLAAQVFNIASYKAVSTLKTYQASNDSIPLDEQIASAELTNISLYGGQAAFDVTIKTEAGDNVEFIVPLPK
jgi:hypothetical protein